MNLTTPIFLAALALLIPVLVTFLVRRQRQILKVPSVMVWRLGARSIAKSRRIRDLRRLLALLACLTGVAALVIAAARPTGTRSDTTVYVVDVSASMAGAPIAEARRWLTREVAGRGPNARIAIVVASSEARVVLAPSPPGPLVEQAITAIVAEKDIASIEEAIALADGLAPRDARVVVLSDQAIEVDNGHQKRTLEQRVFTRTGTSDNVGITSLFTRTAPDARDDEEREATITIATSSTTPRRAHLTVTLGKQLVADRRLALEGGGETSERVLLRGGGRLVARVEPDDGKLDASTLDDEASLDETARRPPRVALVSGLKDGAATYFVKKALLASGITTLLEVDPEDTPPSNAELVVALSDGPGRPVDLPTFFIGIEPRGTVLNARKAAKAELHLRSLATEDSILRGVALDELTTLRAKIATPPEGARTLVDLDAGPTLIVGGAGSRAWVWMGIDPEASDLVLRVAFPVLVSNVIGHLGGASQIVSAKTVPRAEVMLTRSEVVVPLATAQDPRWRVPVGPPMLIACLGAFLLALEAWLTFRRKWGTA